MSERKELVIIKVILVVFIFYGIAPFLQTPKFIKTVSIVVFEVDVMEKFNIVHLDYSRTERVSRGGDFVYVPVGKRRVVVFDGTFPFEVGGVYELTYTPVIVGYNSRPEIREVKRVSS